MSEASRSAARDKAHQAFVRSWRLEALVPVVLFSALAIVGLLVGGHRESLAFAALGAAGSVLSGFWGGVQARVAVPALLAGSIPLGCGLASTAFGHVCLGGSCTSLCVPACTLGGVLAGALVGRLMGQKGVSWGGIASGALLTCSVGAMGCCCVGSAGVIGMGLGFLSAGALSTWWGARRVFSH